MKYGSVCSGIEAATVAWHSLGWEAQWYSEIEPFPCAVLKHHYPNVPNLGDMTKIYERKEFHERAIDLLVGGTPCQSFSVAGLRKGLADPRGNLALVFLGIIDKARPRWVVWENVPGVLSSGGGRDFGAFLGGLAELGYGWAYRVLDAQYFGVPQRRRRVFVVGYFGDWRPAAAVLFERQSLSGNNPPSRKAGQGFTATTSPSLTASGRGVERCGESRGQDPVVAVPDVSPAVTNKWHKGSGGPAGDECQNLIPIQSIAAVREKKQNGIGIGKPGDKMFTLTARDQHAVAFQPSELRLHGKITLRDQVSTLKAETKKGDTESIVLDMRGNGDGNNVNTLTGDHASRPTDYTPIVFSSKDHGADAGETSPTLRAGGHDKSHANAGIPPAAMLGMPVRRLTPRECERLQGFPDDYTLIPVKKVSRNRLSSPKKNSQGQDRYVEINGEVWQMASDGPRYKAIGNSMCAGYDEAHPGVMLWIGKRIAKLEGVLKNG